MACSHRALLHFPIRLFWLYLWQESEIEYLHKGISARNFTRTFNLADNVEVRAATVTNGVLAIALEHVVPEEKKAKKIAITYSK